jgi:hypothetical protein
VKPSGAGVVSQTRRGYVTTKKRMTDVERATVTRWMLDNEGDVAEMEPDYLAQRVYQEAGVEITEGTAFRHRKLCGIAPVKVKQERQSRGAAIETRFRAIEARLGAIERRPPSVAEPCDPLA